MAPELFSGLASKRKFCLMSLRPFQMPLLGQEVLLCRENGSEPLGLHLKYYFISHCDTTEAAGRGGRAGWAVSTVPSVLRG